MGADGVQQIVLTTCPDEAAAERIANELVASGIAACVNVLAPMRSVYRWKGKVETAQEHLLIIKGNDYQAIEARILALHPYELPEILAVPIVGGLAAYLSWLHNPEQ